MSWPYQPLLSATQLLGGPSPCSINVSDSINLSESRSLLVGADILATSDAITVSDIPTVQVEAPPPLEVSVSDSATLAESVEGEVEVLIAESVDSVNLSESVSLLVGDVLVEVSDSITLTDTPTAEVVTFGGEGLNIGGGAAYVDTDLVVRYFVDETASGTDPTHVLDKSGVGTAFDLALTYGTALSYTEAATGRGLQSTSNDGAQRAEKATASGDKVYDSLSGAQKITIELVVDIDSGSASNGRVLVLNSGSSNPMLGLSIALTDWQVWWEETLCRSWTGSTSRQVIHIVYDTTQAATNDRIKIYVNGSLITPDYDSAPAQNDGFSGFSGHSLFMFNRGASGSYDRSVTGMIYYSAIYKRAFSVEEVEQNYDILTLDDDEQTGGSVADSITVSDSPVVEVQEAAADLEVNVSDSVTLAESVSLLVGDVLVEVSDSITVSESVSLLVGDVLVDVSDSITVSDSPAVEVQEAAADLEVNLSDSVTLAESVTAEIPIEVAYSTEGETGDGDNTDGTNSGYIIAYKFTISKRTTIKSLSLREGVGGTLGNVQFAIYDDASPNRNRICFTGSVLSRTTLGLLTADIVGGPITLEPGDYWFGFNKENSNLSYRTYNTPGVYQEWWTQTFGTWPSTLSDPGANWYQARPCMYATSLLAEPVAVSESVSIELSALEVNVSDSIAVTEVTEVLVEAGPAGDLEVSVSDSVTVSESVSGQTGTLSAILLGRFGQTATPTHSGNSYEDNWHGVDWSLSKKATVRSISAYLESQSGVTDRRVSLALYDNESPKNFEAETVEGTLPEFDSAGWVELAIAGGVVLDAGTYWLCWNHPEPARWFSLVSGKTAYYDALVYGSWPSTFDPTLNWGCNQCIYATYEEYELVVVSESCSVQVETGPPEDLGVNVSDSVNLSESVEGEVEALIAEVVDSVNLSESVSLLVGDVLVEVSDSITVSDSPVVEVQEATADLNVSVSDSVTVSESVSLSGGDLTVGINSVFGEFTTGDEDDSTSNDYIIGYKYTLAQAARITGLNIRAWTGGGSINAQLAIYDDSSPRNLLARTGTVVVPGSVAWVRGGIIGGFVDLEAGDYWLCFINQTSTMQYRSVVNTTKQEYWSQTFGTWPATLTAPGSGPWGDGEPCVYADFGLLEHITVGDSASVVVEAISELYINVSDSIAVTEVAELLVGELLLEVSDSVTLTEASDLLVGDLYAEAVDEVSVSESPSVVVEVAGELNVSASDSVTLTEVVAGQVSGLDLSVQDSVTVIEDLSALVSGPLVSVADSTTLTEDVSALVSSVLAQAADAVTVSESVAVSFSDLIIEAIDSIEIFGSVDGKVGTLLVPLIADTVGVSEQIEANAAQFVVMVADAVSLSETTSLRFSAILLSVSDTVTVGESAAAYFGLEVDTSDYVSVAEVVSLAPHLSISLSEAIVIYSEIAVSLASLEVAAEDSVSLAEDISVVVGTVLATASDSVAISESVSGFVSNPEATNLNVTENIVVTEYLEVSLSGLEISVLDSITVSEQPDALLFGDLNVAVTDAVAVSYSTTVTATYPGVLYITTSESVQVAEFANSAGSAIILYAEDSVTVTEYSTLYSRLSASVSDGLVVEESVSLVVSELTLAVSDGVAISESVEARTSAFSVSVYDLIIVIELISTTLDSLKTAVVDVVVLSESVAAAVLPLSIDVTDSVLVTEIPSVYEESGVFVSDLVTVTETPEVHVGDLLLVAYDSVTVLDLPEMGAPGYEFSINVSDRITVSEIYLVSFSRVLYLVSTITPEVSLTSTLVLEATLVSTITEEVSLVSTLIPEVGLTSVILEEVSLTSTIRS